MEESLAEKCKVSWQVHPPGMKEIGGNYVGKCLRLKKEGEREREREREREKKNRSRGRTTMGV